MAITNLTNTKWVMNSIVSSVPIPPFIFSVNFISNGNSYTELTLSYAGSDSPIKYDNTIAYDYGNMFWTNQAYRIIEITGGNDVTNSSLIQWLEANAVQVNVTDLTGTKWVFNNTIDLIPGSYYINFVSNNNSYGYLQRGMIPDPTSVIEFLKYTGDPVYYFSSNAWTDNAYRLISITGGDDVSNPDLIAWLSQNATYQEPTPPTPTTGGSISFGNLSFAKVFLGALEVDKMYYGNVLIYSAEPVILQLDAPTISLSGDTLSIEEVENAEYYDIYVDGVLVESVDVRPTYDVSIAITSESNHWNSKYWFKVYDGTDANGTLLINDTNNTTQTPMNVVCSSGHLYIELATSGSLWYVHTPTATTGITLDTSHFDESNPTYDENLSVYICSVLATVTADGTITFSYIKWED